MGSSLYSRAAIPGIREWSKRSAQDITGTIRPCTTLDRSLQEDDEGGELIQERAGLYYMNESFMHGYNYLNKNITDQSLK